MSVLLEKKTEPQMQMQSRLWPGFHLLMAYACSIVLLTALLAGKLASIRFPNPLGLTIGIAFASGVVFTLAIFWHERGKMDLRDAVMTIPWGLFLAATLPLLVLAAARADMPLQDSNLARFDGLLGISVPEIVSWSSSHRLGGLVNQTYTLLSPLLVISALLPALTGKAKNAQMFVLANVIAFAIGLPLFALLPAIGPWYGYHVAATPHQLDCQSAILLFRAPNHQLTHLDAIICFPSFHVIWAILCAAALSGFRLLRVPVALLSGMIVVSTVTTGWHYFVDVLGGIAVAGLSLAIANAYLRRLGPFCQRSEPVVQR
jgi:membrane-associated phospholipid phosphatase